MAGSSILLPSFSKKSTLLSDLACFCWLLEISPGATISLGSTLRTFASSTILEPVGAVSPASQRLKVAIRAFAALICVRPAFLRRIRIYWHFWVHLPKNINILYCRKYLLCKHGIIEKKHTQGREKHVLYFIWHYNNCEHILSNEVPERYEALRPQL